MELGSQLPSTARETDCDVRRAITCACSHDVQVRSADGLQVVSVRLFETQVAPGCAGLRGPSKTIRIGFETERPVLTTCRPFDSSPVPGSRHQVRVDYHGKEFVVLTKTPMTRESLASVSE